MSVVYGNTAVSNPGTAASRTGGTSRMCSIATRDSSGAMLDRASDGASRVADQVADTFERHPLLIGAIGMMAGALIAALLPPSRAEDATEVFPPAVGVTTERPGAPGRPAPFFDLAEDDSAAAMPARP